MSRKIKERLLRCFLCMGLALLMLFPSAPAFAVSESPFNDYTFDTAAVDEEGYNIIGNTPEQLAQGGFYAAQKDWLFYADWTQNGVLCASNGSRTLTLTDYPVANINVVGDRLVFTDLSATVSRSYAADTELLHNKLTYGGKLYQAQGVKSLMSGGQLGATQQIGGDAAYYRVSLGQDIYGLSGSADGESFGTDWSYVHITDGEITPIVIGNQEESIVNMVDNYMVLYFEIESPGTWGRILRMDAMTRQLMDSIPGRELSILGERVFFISNTNHYLYEMKGNTAQPSVVSSCPIASYAIQDNGDIKALGADGQIELLISLNGDYEGFAGPYQVGEWYNYFKMQYARPKKDDPPPPQEEPFEFTWITEKNILIVDYFEPPEDPPEPPKPPTPSGKMPPEAAVEMVMTIVKGGTTDDEIFNKYYDATAKAAFMKYFEALAGTAFDLESVTKEAMDSLGEDIFTEEHKERISELFKNYFSQIEYTLKTIEETETTAIVEMHLTQMIDVEMKALDMSQNALMSHLMNYMAEQGLDQSYLYSFTSEAEMTDFIMEAVFDYMEKTLLPMKVSETSKIHLIGDEVLVWKIIGAENNSFIVYPPGEGNGGGNGGGGNGGGNTGNGNGNGGGNTGNGNGNGGGNTTGNGGGNGGGNTGNGTTRSPGMDCVYKKLVYEREAPNMWEVLGREAKKLWNDFWGIETPKYEPVDHYLRTELVRGSPFPGSSFCPKELKVIVPGKPKSTWEMIKGWFS